MTGDPSVNFCIVFPLLESLFNTVYDYSICYKITDHVSENNTQHATVIFYLSHDISMSMSKGLFLCGLLSLPILIAHYCRAQSYVLQPFLIL